MSSIFKVAYARGVQHALVATNAIYKYASEEQADAAAAVAAEEIPPEAAVEEQEMPPDVTGAVAAKLVELSQAAGETAAAAAEQSNIAQEAAQVVQALQQGAMGQGQAVDPAAVDPAALGAAAQQLEQKAASLRIRQKRAAMRKRAVGMDAMSGVPIGALEGVTDDLRDAAYATGAPDYNFGGFSVDEGPHPGAASNMNAFGQSSVNLDSKTAAAILRKLAVGMDATSPVPVGDAPGVSEDGIPEQYAMNAPSVNISGMSAIEGMHPGADTSINTFKQGSANSAFDMLFRKTAAEVGPYLPKLIPSSAKVAAVRTMIGMTPPERGSYIQRLHKAAEDAAKDEERCEGCYKDPCACSDRKKEESEEKSAAAILRRLGVGR